MAQSGSISVEVETLNHVLGLIEAFRAFDSDNDGSINAQELGGIMGSLGYNVSEQDVEAMMRKGDTNRDGLLSTKEFLDMSTEEQDVEAMMQKGDTNRDGLLSTKEFLDMSTKDLELSGLSALKTAFEALDLEEHDLLTGEELHQYVENMGIELSLYDCQEIVASLDGDGDGAITVEEFKLLVDSLG